LWDHKQKIVVSDIDGTITKSDMLGHIMPRIGVDWSQPSICDLYQRIADNGYNFIYLTARPIGMTEATKTYLSRLSQQNIKLPHGPIFTSPDRLVKSFNREVILKEPHIFKIDCLQTIKNLFPAQCEPLYSGFGNRDTDVTSYSAVGIKSGKMFIVDPEGNLKHHEQSQMAKKTYASLAQMCDMVFPPVNGNSVDLSEDFNDFNYWKTNLDPLDEIELLKQIE
jgi:phosphatidate phosphatase LPIN